MSLLCAISGGSGSGKTTTSRAVAAHFGPEIACELSFDSYYNDQGHLTPTERRLVNYDHPDSLDSDLFERHLRELAQGHSIEVPIYDFATHTRSDETVTVISRPLVVVDGILAVHSEALRRCFDVVAFVDAPDEVRFERRSVRDVAERGRDLDDVGRQWRETVQPMFERFVAQGRDHADLVVPGVGPIEETSAELIQRLTKLLNDRGFSSLSPG